MAAKKGHLLPRPPRKSEYEVRFATTEAQKGWRDLVATIRNPMTEAWDVITRSPLTKTPTCYPLKGELGKITRGATTHERWQYSRRPRGPRESGTSSTVTRSSSNRCTPVIRMRRSSCMIFVYLLV